MKPELCPDRRTMFRTKVPRNSVGAEIGVARGDFSEVILAEAKPRKLHLVDCWTQQFGDYELDPANVPQADHDAALNAVCARFESEIRSGVVKVWRMFSIDAACMVPNRLDWVYIDADHTYSSVLQDLYLWSPKVKKGGFIMGHDYASNPTSIADRFHVIEAVTRFTLETPWRVSMLTVEEWPSFLLERK